MNVKTGWTMTDNELLQAVLQEDAIARSIVDVPLEERDFAAICEALAIWNLTNEQRLFLLRLAVAPTVAELREPRLGEDEIDG